MKQSALLGMAIALAAGTMLPVAMPRSSRAAAPQEEEVSFRQDVLHIFQRRCVPCHEKGGTGYKESGLLLMTYADVMKGTKYGPMVIPRDPDESNLMRVIDWRASPKINMPHKKKQLSTFERDTIRTWIRQGAKDN